MYRFKSVRFMLLFIFIMMIFAGCNKEKAEAIKVAAMQFRIEAVNALNKVRYLFEQSVSLPSENQYKQTNRIAIDLDQAENIGPAELSFLMTEDEVNDSALKQISNEFKTLESQYYQFESMFQSLPEGSFFAKNAVKKSEKFAIQLTVQFINMAKFLQTYEPQFTGRRVLLLEKISKYKSIADDSLRYSYLRIAAQEIIELRNQENLAREEAITQCFRAVEAGNLISDLIRNYSKMCVKDLLATTRNTLDYISNISPEWKDISIIKNQLDSTEYTIQNDPYWKNLLNLEIIN
ncbi:MAG: hypothetical protein P8Y60_04590 [Calditrichota bacterium]|jgi:hypothetical protein